MSAALVRLNKRRRTCATPNRREEAPISGRLITLVCVLILAFAVATDVHRAIATVLQSESSIVGQAVADTVRCSGQFQPKE